LILYSAPRAIIGVLLLAAVAINIVNIIARYMFQSSIFWAEEVLVFIVLWGVFLGAVAAAYQGDHLKVDLFSVHIGGPLKVIVNVLLALTFIVCSIIVAAESIQVIARMAQTGQVSVAAGIPVVVPHAALFVGFTLMALAVIVRFGNYVRDKFD
jgi:TRAP-type C4-dicarboxylate transport system permease small subunit